ncbi:Crp/Fnr family transcriptional regulator, partial [Reyranella sp.]|uniref:Crp/Fnr family transcriptional regulator n=1 Tax=Reyranella sp. TaxID=1929291 RepID=UPI003F724352
MSLAEPSEDTARLRLQKVLQQTPLFADLDAEALKRVEHELTLLVLPGGASLFRAGEPADAVYVVTSGCLGVFRHEEESEAREPLLIAEVPPGNLVGEMSLLSQGKRTRSVAALRDSEVWRLPQTGFNALTSNHPEVLPALMRSVVSRNAVDAGKRRRQPRTFAILPSGPDIPAARFAVLLANALGRIGTQVQMLGSESLDQEPEWFARCEMESSFVLY